MQIITILRKVFALFLGFFLCIGVPDKTAAHDVKNPEECKTNFAVLSDVHVEGVSNDNDRSRPARQRFVKALRDIKNNKSGTDAIVFVGDNTMCCQDIENLFFWGAIETIAPAEKIYTAMGNHDTGNGSNTYEKSAKRFWSYYNGFTDSSVEAPYYYYVALDDCYLIFMASESDAVNNPEISTQQINWVDKTLSKAEKAGVPAFVFNHHTPWHFNDNTDEFIEVLTKHHNVFYMSGHTHTTKLTALDFDEDSHFFNLPKSTDMSEDTIESDEGVGLQVEIYNSRVVIRGRRFYNSEWTNYEFEYTVK